jgi:hypothetical protein
MPTAEQLMTRSADELSRKYYDELHLEGVTPEMLEEAMAWAIADRTRRLGPVQAPGLTEAEQAALAEVGARPASTETIARRTTRSDAVYAALIETSLHVRDVAKMMGMADPSGVRQYIARRQLYAIADPRRKNVNRLPAFQFNNGSLVPRIREVLPSLPEGIHPVAVQGFFTTPQPELEGPDEAPMTPRDWLIAGGDPEPVVALVANL